VLHNLGFLLNAQADPVAARRVVERALAILEKAFGADHPDTITLRNNFCGPGRAARVTYAPEPHPSGTLFELAQKRGVEFDPNGTF